jgi:hypothetical protein
VNAKAKAFDHLSKLLDAVLLIGFCSATPQAHLKPTNSFSVKKPYSE